MSRATERIAEQDQHLRDDAQHERPNVRPTPIAAHDSRGPHFWPCQARVGFRHDISMRRPGGAYACWYCARTKQQIVADAALASQRKDVRHAD